MAPRMMFKGYRVGKKLMITYMAIRLLVPNHCRTKLITEQFHTIPSSNDDLYIVDTLSNGSEQCGAILPPP